MNTLFFYLPVFQDSFFLFCFFHRHLNMNELFTRMMSSLGQTVTRIETEMSKLFAADRKKLAEVQWTQYEDNLGYLQYRLKQLNSILHFEYEFEENLANDVVNYSKMLNENRAPCEELVGFLLRRNDDPWTRDETTFLIEVLNGIISNCDRINSLLK